MPANNNPKQYIELPISSQDTPLHLFDAFAPPAVPSDPIELALHFISRIDSATRSKNCPSEILSLYLNDHPYYNTNVFAEKDWPAVHQIQTQYEQKDFSAKIQTLYNQLRLRSKFQRLRKAQKVESFVDVAEQSWQNYQSILERQSKEINFSPMVIWDIIDNFLSQLGKYHEAKLASNNKKDYLEHIFNLETSKKLLDGLIKFIPTDSGKQTNSKEIFGYYSLLASAVIEVYSGRYREALGIISRLSLPHMTAYSKSIGALLTLLHTASYAYFMLQQYKESARVSQMAILFFQKNKKYFSTPIIEQSTSPFFQKLSCLLCLSYIMLQQKPKPIIMQLFKVMTLRKEKQIKQKLADKYAKLKQGDQSTFGKLFQISALTSINTDIKKIEETVFGRFKAMQKITLNTILQNYTQISVGKVGKILKLTEGEVLQQIQSFNNISTGSAAWDRTIMEPLLSQTRKLKVQVIDSILMLDADQGAIENLFEWQQYHQEIGWLVQKVASL